MSADAAVQLRRLLNVIPRLNDGKSHSIDEVARLAGADRDTVLRDLFSLSHRLGDPGGFVPGLQVYIESGDRGVSLQASHFKRPMGLTRAELCALELGLAMLRPERPPDEQRVIDRARERLRRMIAKLPNEEVSAPQRYGQLATRGDNQHLVTFRHGVRDRRQVRITYRSADAQESRTRTICPYGLVASRGAWYVVAHCDDTDGIRIYRLDRVEEAKLLTTSYDVPPSFSLDSVVQGGRLFHGQDGESLRVRYSPRISRWIAEREDLPLDADRSVTVEYPLADAQWAVRHVLQYGPDAEVLAPASVRKAVADRLARTLRSWQQPL